MICLASSKVEFVSLFLIPKTANLKKAKKALAQYLAIDLDFDAMRDSLPWRSDPILKQAIDAYPYLRILRQPLSETLLGFLCSSTKQISQIKQILRLSAESYGEPIFSHYKSLPTWDILEQLEENQLRRLKLGYRANYIKKSADLLKINPQYLKELPVLPTQDAKKMLMQLPGVGEKIADCVLLFGLGRMESFPIDTWIEKILIRFYQLEGYSKNQLQQFARAHFGANAGYAQQFLFSAARSAFKHIEYYYFHNCLYEGVWKNNSRRWSEQFETFEILRTYGEDYKCIFVGDASMSPYEIMIPGGGNEHYNEEAGHVWLERVTNKWSSHLWINPTPQKYWSYSHTTQIIKQIFDNKMVPLTIEGLVEGTKILSRKY